MKQPILILNIAMTVSGTKKQWTTHDILDALVGVGINNASMEQNVVDGLTAVVSVYEDWPSLAVLNDLCENLDQEAIAAWSPPFGGAVVGPKWEQWSPFKLEAFKFPSDYLTT